MKNGMKIPMTYILTNNVLNNPSKCVFLSQKQIVHCNVNELKRATPRDEVHI